MDHDSNIAPHPIRQPWHQNGKCPKNTIPIRRTKEEDAIRGTSIRRYGKKRPRSIPNLNLTNDPTTPNVLSGHQVQKGVKELCSYEQLIMFLLDSYNLLSFHI
jgi:hypothetical protein